MAGNCTGEINGQGILVGCPADTELVLVMNSTAAGNNGGYGLRYIGDLRKCFLSNLKFTFLDFIVGDTVMSQGQTVLVITQSNIIQDSVFITLGGPELPRGDNTQVSYTVDYSNPLQVTITFNQAVQDGQQYIGHFAYFT
jgi:hypothetical protein